MMDRPLLLWLLPLLMFVFHLKGTAEAQQISYMLAVQTTEGIVLLDPVNNLTIGLLPNSSPTGYMAWSESGRYLAYYGSSLLEETGLQVFDVTTQTTTMLDASPRGASAGSLRGVWFGDELLYYTASFSDDGALFRADLSDGAPEVILEGHTHLGKRCGDYLMVSQGEDGYLLALPTGELTPLRQQIEHHSTTCRDANHLFYAVNDETGVTVYEYDVSTQTEAELFYIEGGNMNLPIMSYSDGLNFYVQRENRLDYVVWDGETLSVQDDPPWYSPDEAYAVYVLPGEGELYSELVLWTRESDTRQTFTERAIEYTWSPMSDKIAYTDQESVHIYTIANGTTQTYTPCTPDICLIDVLYYSCGDWSPNGRWVMCQANGYRDAALYTYLVDTETTTTVQLTDIAVNFTASPIAWQPNE